MRLEKKEVLIVKALYFEEHGDLDMIQYEEVPEPPGLS